MIAHRQPSGWFFAKWIAACALAALVVTCAGGCGFAWDMPDAPVSPELDPGTHMRDSSAWRAEVSSAIDVWTIALKAHACPDPFAIVDDGHPVRLVPASAWTEANAIGEEYGTLGDDWIQIREPSGAYNLHGLRATLLHELGHAMGLDHVPDDEGPSIMTATIKIDYLTPADVDRAADALGCGP